MTPPRARRPLATTILTVRAATWMAVVGVLKFLLPLPRLAALVGGRPAHGPRDPEREAWIVAQVDRVARAIRLAHPGNCLERSLTLYRLLGTTGAHPRLLIGVRRDAAIGIAGHAWVTVDGHAVGEQPDETYATLMAFGDPSS